MINDRSFNPECIRHQQKYDRDPKVIQFKDNVPIEYLYYCPFSTEFKREFFYTPGQYI
ncbi:MAG: hypothetical protein Fur0020_00390 [Thermodesulfovibrionia bacterium]